MLSWLYAHFTRIALPAYGLKSENPGELNQMTAQALPFLSRGV